MNWVERVHRAWLNFWYFPPPLVNLAMARVGVGAVLLYVLTIRSYDLEAMFSGIGIQGLLAAGEGEPFRAPFNLFSWFEGSGWVWTIHVMAMVVATSFLLGIYSTASGALALVIVLSYGAQNPVIWMGVDGLLVVALVYLTLAPSDRALTVLWWRAPQPDEPSQIYRPLNQDSPPQPWRGIIARVLQIHLCVLYFHSGLAKMNQGWLQGVVLQHPRVADTNGGPVMQPLLSDPGLALGLNLVLLFELFYGVLIWLPGLRWIVLVAALVVHLWVGFAWERLPFNLLMLFLNLVFLPPRPLEWLAVRTRAMVIELVMILRGV